MIVDKIKILHVNDNHAREDRHLAPGFGTTKFDELLPILFDAGFNGFFNMECSVPRRNYDIMLYYYDLMAKSANILIEESKAKNL